MKKINIISGNEFEKIAGNGPIFAEIVDIKSGERITFTVRYFTIKENIEFSKVFKFSVEGNEDIDSIVLLHTKHDFKLAGKNKKEEKYMTFSQEFTDEVQSRIMSIFPQDIIIAESRD